MAAVLDASDVTLPMPATTALLTPIVMTIPLQLLAYHIAVRRGCDVDPAKKPGEKRHGRIRRRWTFSPP